MVVTVVVVVGVVVVVVRTVSRMLCVTILAVIKGTLMS